MQTLLAIMEKDHERINQMLLEFDKAPKEKNETSMLFSEFKWNLEKHLFTEERVIFAMLREIEGLEMEDMFNLLEEHKQIIELAKKEEESIKLGSHSDISPLLMLLKKHVSFEDDVFYPKLDELLNENQKKEIIKRIKSIIIY